MRLLTGIALVAWCTVALFALPPALVLLLTAETTAGRLFALATLLFLPLPIVLRSRRRAGLALAGAGAVCLAPVLWMAPDGSSQPSSPVHSRFLGEPRHPRFGIGNLVPEIDQIKTGSYLVPFLDPILTQDGGRRVRDLSMAIYRPMERDPNYRRLGSIMPFAYGDEDPEQLYEIVPPGSSTPLPLIVFVHGSGGNFKSYLYLWQRFAERHPAVIVAPSFGFGNWARPGGVEAIERARRWALEHTPIDPARIFLVGLSNGGLGVTRAAIAEPGAYAGIAYLSGVTEPATIAGDPEPWRGRRILLLHGAVDDRIPAEHIDRTAVELRAAGADVTHRSIEAEDHFLFFSIPDRVFDEIAAFITRQAE